MSPMELSSSKTVRTKDGSQLRADTTGRSPLRSSSRVATCSTAIIKASPGRLASSSPVRVGPQSELLTANCIIIAQFPIENHSEQGQFAELAPENIGKSAKFGAIIMQFAVALLSSAPLSSAQLSSAQLSSALLSSAQLCLALLCLSQHFSAQFACFGFSAAGPMSSVTHELRLCCCRYCSDVD
jgi:hypothetical protein